MNQPDTISIQDESFHLNWKLRNDLASLHRGDQLVWQGALLPSLWLQEPGQAPRYVPAELSGDIKWQDDAHGSIPLLYGDVARGCLEFSIEAKERTLSWDKWSLDWAKNPLPLHSIYVGARLLNEEGQRRVASLEKPFWPDWQAEGFCVPGGHTAPIRSFFRKWDTGQSRLALGNFAPSMGAPYGAAYPRPILAAGFGNENGWLVAGVVEAPDGAMFLRKQSSCACFEFLMREDLWGPPSPETNREWPGFLKLVWEEEAVDAFGRFYYPEPCPTQPAPEQTASWNTWGEFKEGRFDLDEALVGAQAAGAQTLVYDDFWEEMNSNSRPDYQRFPNFDEQVERATASGMQIGFWQSVGWIDHPEAVGLDKEDLLCGADGEPRLCSWSFNPLDDSPRHYALDPSSPRTQAFLRERTQHLLRAYPVSQIKVDFAYGLPGLEVASPRDPQLRGERLGIRLIEIIAEAAREIQPEIGILGYSVHPVVGQHCNILSLDDLGDAAGRDAEGHGQWSFWSSIAGRGGQVINASGGYNWEAETDILLNTAVIGGPGAIYPLRWKNGHRVGPEHFRKRRALSRWHRRTKGWSPLWLNSHLGDPKLDPKPRCWGRLERHAHGEVLTALALRGDEQEGVQLPAWPRLIWSGNWALLSQDNQSIFATSCLACLPLESNARLAFDEALAPSRVTEWREVDQTDVEQESTLWHYQEGCLGLNVTPKQGGEELLGFLVYRA